MSRREVGTSGAWAPTAAAAAASSLFFRAASWRSRKDETPGTNDEAVCDERNGLEVEMRAEKGCTAADADADLVGRAADKAVTPAAAL
jgi:hypothetical protein